MRLRMVVPEEHVHPDIINPFLEGMTRLDEHMIRSGQTPTATELVQQGAVWRPEPPGDEHFDHGATIAARGWGDCDDWAPLRTAELRATGEDKGAKAEIVPSGPQTWHAIVRRSDGSVDDPSVKAGMPKPKQAIIGGVSTMQVAICDPHDGRLYQGALAPTTGPLSMHCGPQIAVRGVHIVGQGMSFQGRCDMPLCGSPLIPVHLRRRGRILGGSVPYAFSCTSLAPHPGQALDQAIMGAVMCGDAAELVPNLDRYQLIATQMGMAGHPPEVVREAIAEMIHADLQEASAATGAHPGAHLDQLKGQLASRGVMIQGAYIGDFFGDVGHFVSDVGKVASGVVHTVAPIVDSVAKVVNVVPWGDIVHGIEAAVSLVPGLGTAVSDVIAAGETALNAVDAVLSGSPLKFAIQSAYNFAMASIPGVAGLRIILDPYVNQVLNFAVQKTLLDTGALNKFLNSVPDKPAIGNVNPRSIVASLLHLLVGSLGLKNTSGKPSPKPAPKPSPSLLAQIRMPVIRANMPKPLGVPHAAAHVSAPQHNVSPVSNIVPPHPAASVAPQTHVLTPTGSFHWHCEPGAGGVWQCRWVMAA